MSTLAPYITGGLIAIVSSDLFGWTLGLPASPFAGLAALRSTEITQTVDRSRKGDRLIPTRISSTGTSTPTNLVFGAGPLATRPASKRSATPEALIRSEWQGSFRWPTTIPIPVQKPTREENLPDGCDPGVSVMVERRVANQARRCITWIPTPTTVAAL
jgi:hypothetical protein